MATHEKEHLFDSRTVERNIAQGRITREEYNAYLAGLEDSEEQSTKIEAEFVEGVLDDKEDKEDA